MYRANSDDIMKALVVILLSLFGLAKADWNWMCGNKYDVYTTVFPTRCTSFILCNGGHATVMECPEGSWYDQTLLICLPAELVECTRDVPDYVKLICNDLPSNATIPATTCERYYECNNHKPIEFECKNGQHYSRAYTTCMNPLKAGCAALERMCIYKDPGFGFPAPNCKDFYRCNNNLTPVLWFCGEGEYYSANSQACVASELSGCIPDIDEPQLQGDSQTPCGC